MRNKRSISSLALLLVAFSLLVPAGFAHAAPPIIQPVLVSTLLTSQFYPSSPDPSGLAYNPNTGTLILSDSEVEENLSLFAGANIFIVTLSGQVSDSFATTTNPVRSFEPAGVAYNPGNNHMYIADDDARKIIEVNPGSDGRFNTADDVVHSFSTIIFGNNDPEGITYDSWRNHLVLTSGSEEEVYDIDPGPNGIFEGTGDDIVSHFDTSGLGLRDPESVEFNSDTGNLFVLSALSNKIAEITPFGEVLRYIDITSLNGLFESGLAYAPGSSNPTEKHLYIVARGIDSALDPGQNDGKLYEISFPLLPPVPTPTASSTLPITATVTLTPTMTITPSPTIDPAIDVLFADGFERGDVSAWSSASTNDGNLAVTLGSALIGNYGLSANIAGNTGMYVEYNHPGVESRYRARFYFDVNSLAMAAGDSHVMFYGYSNATARALRIELRRSSTGLYQLRPAVWNDSGTWVLSSFLTISDAPHFIELDYQASSAPGANNGFLTFWIDGLQAASLGNLDNDTRLVDFVRLGPQAGILTGTRGVDYFDAFEARRFSYIGPAVPSTVTPVSSWTPVPSTTPSSTVLPTLTASHTPLPTSTVTDTPTDLPAITHTSTSSPTTAATSTLSPTATDTATAILTATSIPTTTPTPSPTADAALDVIFVDGFESGDLAAWSNSSTNAGNLAVTVNSSLVGGYGLNANIGNVNPMYVEYNHPGVEAHYRARFYFDVNTIAMAKGDSHLMFYGYSSSNMPVLRIELRRPSTGHYQLRPAVWNDSGTWVLSSYLEISDAPHFIEFDYQASGGPGLNNGFLTFWIDGIQKASLIGVDNDTRQLDYLRLGPVSGIDTGTLGTYYFDAFEARRFSYIGPAIP